MNAQVPDRRALGLPKPGRRRRGGIMMFAGVLLVAIGAYLAGTTRSDGDASSAASPPDRATEGDAANGTTDTAGDRPDGTGDSDPSVAAAREASIEIPVGHEGVALTLPFSPGGGGYVGAGDRVNVFSIEGERAGVGDLVLGAVTVLDVSVEVAPRVQTGTGERPSTSQVTYLLAVPSEHVAQVVATAQTKTVYLSLLPGAGGERGE